MESCSRALEFWETLADGGKPIRTRRVVRYRETILTDVKITRYDVMTQMSSGEGMITLSTDNSGWYQHGGKGSHSNSVQIYYLYSVQRYIDPAVVTMIISYQ
jgi:hypothetical protein